MTHESTLQPYQPYDRTDLVEGRLTNQERTMGVLLEQALRIKEEVAASVQSEAFSRRLLESHIHTITHIVKQLSTDLQALQGQIAQRDRVTTGTSYAVQSLDHKNLTGIGDLRGRVARCDASIVKLSGDVRRGERDLLRLQQDVSELRSALDLQLRDMESKLSQAVGQLDASLTEQGLHQRTSWTDLSAHIRLLEDRSSSGLKEAREDTERLRSWVEEQLRSADRTHAQGSEQLQSLLHDKTKEVEARLEGQLRVLAVRVERAEGRLEKERQADRLGRAEAKLHSRISAVEARLREELQLAKQEYQSGFKSIHDAIESLKQIGDAKARLDKERLQKDIRHIRRTVVELRDA